MKNFVHQKKLLLIFAVVLLTGFFITIVFIINSQNTSSDPTLKSFESSCSDATGNPAETQILYTKNEDDIFTITVIAPITCCLDVEGNITYSENTLHLTYQTSGDPCDCICNNIMTYTISGIKNPIEKYTLNDNEVSLLDVPSAVPENFIFYLSGEEGGAVHRPTIVSIKNNTMTVHDIVDNEYIEEEVQLTETELSSIYQLILEQDIFELDYSQWNRSENAALDASPQHDHYFIIQANEKIIELQLVTHLDAKTWETNAHIDLLNSIKQQILDIVYNTNEINNIPPIVDFFACGDNCPEPESQYWVKIYEGVNTQRECEKYDGEFKSFTGWGTTYYCEVKE